MRAVVDGLADTLCLDTKFSELHALGRKGPRGSD